MSTPIDAYREAFQKAFAQMWGQASLMILGILFLLGLLALVEFWMEWKSCGQRY